MTEFEKASPRPWKVPEPIPGVSGFAIDDADGHEVGTTDDSEMGEENAALIVRAVNSFAPLVAAVRELIECRHNEHLPNWGDAAWREAALRAYAALAVAEGTV